MTALLAAVDDQEQALRAAQTLAQQADARARDGADAGAELATLALMLDADLLLHSPLTTKLAIQRERDHWTESRMKENERRRKRMAAKRHGLGGEGE